MEPVPLTIRSPTLAPGARVVVRDAEWVVRRVDSTPDGGSQLVCDGVSELVREREAVFLTRLERQIEVLDPAGTLLVRDESPQFADSRLYIESLLRQAAPSDKRIRAGHLGAMDSVAYQLAPARQALRQPRQRILIADAVGLGKTLEAGVLVSELIARGRGRRILVLALKSMLTQFQKEFWNRFTIPLTRLDSVGIQRVRRRIPTSHNPFHYYDKSIISIDTLKQDREYRTYLEQAYWDVIVIDEAHNVADRGTGSLRSRLARLLARRSDTLIMLTATPHDGKARSFASLVNMLDATAITDPEDYRREDFRDKGLVIRRFKKDIRADVRDAFRDREVHRSRFPASEKEERAYEALLAVKVARAGRARASAGLRAQASGGALTGSGTVASGGALASSEAVASGGALAGSEAEATDLGADAGGQDRRDLFSVTLEKALFSSPAACLATVDNRIRRRERELNQRTADGTGAAPAAAAAAEVGAEVTSLRALRDALAVIGPRDHAKYQALLDAIRGGRPFRWKASGRGAAEDRLVVFTERIETLRWLRKHLAEDLGLASAQVAILHGTMSDVDQQRVVEDFGNAKRPVRLLLCSDVASEGINLHYHCHRLIHFDMPWSLMVFQQRNGRVDRYGQKRRPQIVYLVAESRNKRIRGDTRILEILQAKDEQAYKNIGDPATFMNVHDVSAEEEITAKAMAEGEEADAFDARHQPKSNKAEDLLALFLGTAGGSRQGPGEQGPATDSREPAPERGPPAPPLSLFVDDLAYCEQALHRLRRRNPALPLRCGRRLGFADARRPGRLAPPLRSVPSGGGPPGRTLSPDDGSRAHRRGHRREPPRRACMAEAPLPLAAEPGGRLAERPNAGRLRPTPGAGRDRGAAVGRRRGRVRAVRDGAEPQEPSSCARMGRRGVPGREASRNRDLPSAAGPDWLEGAGGAEQEHSARLGCAAEAVAGRRPAGEGMARRAAAGVRGPQWTRSSTGSWQRWKDSRRVASSSSPSSWSGRRGPRRSRPTSAPLASGRSRISSMTIWSGSRTR